jgi:hypothetical protein
MKYSTIVRIKAAATVVLLLLGMSSKITNSASDRQQISSVTAVNALSHAN